MASPDYNRSYRVGGAHLRGALHLDPAPYADLELWLSSTQPPPGRLERVEGKRVHDFVSISYATWLVSPRVSEVLEGCGATGVSVCERGGYAEVFPGLHGYGRLVVTGIAGAIDESRAVPAMSVPATDGEIEMPVLRGLTFEGDEWDGNDFGVCRGSALVFVTERVRTALTAIKASGVEFERLTEYEFPVYDD